MTMASVRSLIGVKQLGRRSFRTWCSIRCDRIKLSYVMTKPKEVNGLELIS